MIFQKLIDYLFGRKQTKQRRFNPRRAYEAANIDRYNFGWTTTQTSADTEVYRALQIVRSRCREQAENNDYVKRYLNLLKNNIIGPKGIKLQAKATDPNGTLDVRANEMIESAWKDFMKKGNFTVDGELSGVDAQKLFVESVARDGEVLVRKVKGWRGNKYGFALQFIEADHLDETLNVELENGNVIIMGREFDKWKRCVAYWVNKTHPGDFLPGGASRIRYGHEVIPADEIIYGGMIERPGQSRCMPWLATALKRLKMLDGYEEAELIAARVSASKMGFFTSTDGEGYRGADTEDEYTPIMEAEPGTFEQLPQGMDFKAWDPEHPSSAFSDYVKTNLRGVASGLNVSYVTLANDLEGVSYSSIRQGELNDRDNWRMYQAWVAEHFLDEVYEQWLEMALTTQAILLPLAKKEKFMNVTWQGRGWQWVDPSKEVSSNVAAVQAGFKTLLDVVGEQGQDMNDTLTQLSVEKEIAKNLGLNLVSLINPDLEDSNEADN